MKLCADCGEEMTIRLNRNDDSEFWRCSAYPECTYTEPVEDENSEGWDRERINYNV